jgi:lysophospholipase L1-like esterase
MCHRSGNGFPRQYAALTQTFPSTAVVHLACSGGTLQDLDNIHWAKGPNGTIYFNPGSPYTTPAAPSGSSYSWNGGTAAYGEPASQVDVLRQIHAPKLVTISPGIGDAGFASVLTTCITHLSCHQAYTNPDGSDQLQKTIDGLQAPVTQALQDIKAAVPAGTTIVVILYPVGFNSNSWTCTPISQTDVAWLMARGHQLDQMLIAAAASAGVSYLNEENAFQGHELCASDPYLNNLTTVNQADKHTLNNSFHPTAGGYTKVAHDLRNYLTGIP